MKKWRVAGINFDHLHMGDLLREVYNHAFAEIVGVCDFDQNKMQSAISNFNIPNNLVFNNLDKCILETNPDLVITCPATADHANYLEKISKYPVHILIEKPFAPNTSEAKRMIESMKIHNKKLAINWPLAWYPCHVKAKKILEKGFIGELREVHFYDGNRGPLYHLADKIEVSEEEVEKKKKDSWWYKKELGGGSLLDYLGYGTTLGTWFFNGKKPETVTTITDKVPNIEVDQHSITICRYGKYLSKFETKWGTFSDPWTTQPQPKCGFVLVCEGGTISSYDFEKYISIQTKKNRDLEKIDVDELPVGKRSPVEYVLDCIENDKLIEGPLNPEFCLIGQRIVDTAYQSSFEGKTLNLING
ncbi:MAG: glucose-fructose oxidoreductase [Parcubacteria group bacterium]|nr:glucose-fructose oxidoreductase [Parcubacteria group bacterium]